MSYDAAGRLAQARYGGGGGVWVTHNYYPWVSGNGDGNGRYWGMNVGGTPGGWNVATTWYSYDTYGNPAAHVSTVYEVEKNRTTFSYDGQNRLRKSVGAGFGESFTWLARGVLASKTLTSSTTVVTSTYAYDPVRIHAMDKVDGANRYDYDANGSMIARTLQSGAVQELKWDSHNRLAQVTGSGVSESYRYDERGHRIRKTAGGAITDYPFPGYERTRSAGVDTVTKHYSFNGVNVAVRSGTGAPTLLYQDGINSAIYATNLSGSPVAARGYYAYGGTRFSEGAMPSDRHFTGQREDATGLYYYGARFYDPQIGQFISPDTIVPDPTMLIDYNRYLYARGNPLKYNDPTGHVVVTHCMCGGGYIEPSEYMRQRNLSIAVDGVQTALDVAGTFDPTGIADGANTIISAGRGNWTDAGISALAIIPLIGDIGKGFKYAGKAYSSTELAAELGYEVFTHHNYREGLRRFLGKTKEEIAGLQAHHILPQTLEDQFIEAGIENIHDPRLLTWVTREHQGWTSRYQREWENFFETNPDADASLILQKAQQLAKEYEFDVYFKTP